MLTHHPEDSAGGDSFQFGIHSRKAGIGTTAEERNSDFFAGVRACCYQQRQIHVLGNLNVCHPRRLCRHLADTD